MNLSPTVAYRQKPASQNRNLLESTAHLDRITETLPEHLVSWIELIYSSPGTSQTQKLWKQWDKKEFFVRCSIKQLFQATISVMLMTATQSLGSSEGTSKICGWPLGTMLELYPREIFFSLVSQFQRRLVRFASDLFFGHPEAEQCITWWQWGLL